MARIELKGIHRVERRVKHGINEHHYAWRGGPKFWSSNSDIEKNSPEYIAALAAFTRTPKSKGISVPQMVDAYLDSVEFKRGLKPRTQADYKKWADRFSEEFKDDPASIFEDPASRGEMNDWRKQWMHSPKQYDYAGTVVARILNWAREEQKIREHHCDKLKKIYSADRSEIVWTVTDLAAFNKVAPTWVKRILAVALETGLRPGDLVRLSRSHIEPTPEGQRIKLRTNKKGRTAAIPVTAKMQSIIDETPADQFLILVSQRGRPLTEHRASVAVGQWRDKAGLSSSLRLQDARGTAATRLLRAGCSLNQIAAHMGWSLRYAGGVIERYAAVSPDESDEILTRLSDAK